MMDDFDCASVRALSKDPQPKGIHRYVYTKQVITEAALEGHASVVIQETNQEVIGWLVSKGFLLIPRSKNYWRVCWNVEDAE